MEDAVRDFVLRMTGGRADVADLCARTVGDVAEGSVCRRVGAGERKLLGSAPGVVTEVAPDTPVEAVGTPFVLCQDLLYTRRNWQYERMVKVRVDEMAAQGSSKTVEPPKKGIYAALRPEQRAAVATMCRERFSILTGGPGTGKTFTIARAVCFVRSGFADLRLGLAAPTGKAAVRMMESMQRAMDNVPKATTLHALLGPSHDLVTFRHHRGNPLPLDWLIVDEASMIGLPMMAKLLDALPAGCRLTLVGDVDQLASVERGHVLGDLCRMPNVRICRLAESARFPSGGAIAKLASAVNENRPGDALAVLRSGGDVVSYVDVTGHDPFRPQVWPNFGETVARGFAAFAASRSEGEALAHVNDFRILCGLRKGPYGVERMNEFVKRLLGSAVPTPLMITQNDQTQGVSNGDVGVVMPGDPKHLFLSVEGGGVRAIRVELIPFVEPAYATTIHKAQGSEFTDVAIVLPPAEDSPLLTREILYTGITRTVKRVFVYAGEPTVRRCCERTVERISGLVPAAEQRR